VGLTSVRYREVLKEATKKKTGEKKKKISVLPSLDQKTSNPSLEKQIVSYQFFGPGQEKTEGAAQKITGRTGPAIIQETTPRRNRRRTDLAD